MGAVIGAAGSAAGGMIGGQQAAQRQQEAAIENIRFLREQGGLGAQSITGAEQRARGIIGGLPGAAVEPIQPFADIGRQAFTAARGGILAGSPQQALVSDIARSARGGIAGARGLTLTDPVMERQARIARLSGQRVSAPAQQQLLQLGRTGVGAAGDIAGIRARGSELLGDIARQAGAARASALIGQTPEIAQQIGASQQARLLSQLGQQQAVAGVGEQAAQLAGRGSV